MVVIKELSYICGIATPMLDGIQQVTMKTTKFAKEISATSDLISIAIICFIVVNMVFQINTFFDTIETMFMTYSMVKHGFATTVPLVSYRPDRNFIDRLTDQLFG